MTVFAFVAGAMEIHYVNDDDLDSHMPAASNDLAVRLRYGQLPITQKGDTMACILWRPFSKPNPCFTDINALEPEKWLTDGIICFQLR